MSIQYWAILSKVVMPNTIASTRNGDGAASAVEQRVLGWCRSHEGAFVAEKREAAKLIMEGFVQAYDDKAAEFASQWCDYRAEQGGARLKQVVTMTVYEPGSVDDMARYQAKKLAKEGVRRVRQERCLPQPERDDRRQRGARQGRGRDVRPRADGLRDLPVLPDAGEPRRCLPHAQDSWRVEALPPRMRLQGGPQLRGRRNNQEPSRHT